MNRAITLRSDERGGAVVEFALAVPVLISFIYGIAKIGMVMAASAGMQHALGQAARYGTLCLNPTAAANSCNAPTDAQLQAVVTASVYGTGNGTLGALSITAGPNTSAGNNYKDLSLTYSQPLKLLFFNGPTVTITRTKRVYLSTTT